MFEVVAFYLFSTLSIACFAFSVFSKNILYAMSALSGGMIFISALFFLLGAEFLGVVQIIVYTGAVMVLYAFSMMFFDVSKDVDDAKSSSAKRLIYTLSTFIALILVVVFCAPIIGKDLSNELDIQNLGNIELIGLMLFSKYLLVFEMTAVMLLVAMVAGIVLVHKDMDAISTDMQEII
ncbi:NADH-quinone oxidoreductase subunit J [Campylobacter sp. faydin G-24]|uniref:NADH-quinone oxidoreductase subunit J n=1 Tax=Campylobacter anatolicus TaxID=2829105 RepID=A0ABS5HG17_9BACT|nr:NADH-quinone oxidoreductase subunit J [Campylobacter anatolicus]MBR8463224.1 NADH-quinone oxidoreductase subunit J [Campylobacter anatolicus]